MNDPQVKTMSAGCRKFEAENTHLFVRHAEKVCEDETKDTIPGFTVGAGQ